MPRTVLPNPRQQPRFSGLTTFGRYPRLDDVAPEHRPLDWIVFGAPFDSGVTYRPGARFGPRAIRAESQYLKPHHLAHAVTVTDVLSIADAGDAPVQPYDLARNAEAVAAWVCALPDAPHARPLMLGGDHSNTLANLRAARARRALKGPMALLHFDSHLDTVDRVFDSAYSHASPFIRAIEEGLIDPALTLSVGVKGPLNSAADLDYPRRQGLTILTYDAWRAETAAGSLPSRTIAAFLDRLRAARAPVYLTFDIDCIDPAFAPGTGTPSAGGFTSAEALALIRAVAPALGPPGASAPHLVGADVVEVLPDRDPAGITAFLAAHIAFEILALDAAATAGR
ncbi:MAG: arginase family protein [Phycisphaerales bacterium]|nr:arginase family protein [Phycisphaerales bacterium]